MDFFDKLGSFARSVSDKTGDMLEISKLNAQIRSHEDDIEELKLKLGEYYYSKYDSGVIMDTQASSICKAIKAAYGEIRSCRAEIAEIRRAQEELRGQSAREAEGRHIRDQAKEVLVEASQVTVIPGGAACPACGAALAEGSRFCGGCGARLY